MQRERFYIIVVLTQLKCTDACDEKTVFFPFSVDSRGGILNVELGSWMGMVVDRVEMHASNDVDLMKFDECLIVVYGENFFSVLSLQFT